MKKSKMSKALIIGALAVSMILPLGVSALANDSDTTLVKDSLTKSNYKTEMRKGDFHHDKRGKFNSEEKLAEFEILLDDLIKDGTLTSSQVDKLKDFIQASSSKRIDLFSELIDQKILTQEQVDAIHEKLHVKRIIEKKEMMQTKLDKLVDTGIITKDDASEILDFLNEKMEEREAAFEKVKDMTVEERREYLKENRPEKGSFIKELVDEGIITEEQGSDINKLMPDHRKGFSKKKGHSKDRAKGMINDQVEKGTISQEKATKILEFIAKKEEERNEFFEKVRDMTAEEKKAYFEENKPQRGNLMEELVEEGIITQDEADELSKNLPKYHKGSKGHGGRR